MLSHTTGRRKLTYAFTAVLMAGGFALADDELDAALRAGNNVAHEHMVCSAYFSVSAWCLEQNQQTKELAGRYHEFAAMMFERGSEFGRVAGVSRKAAAARLELSIKTMTTEDLEMSCTNVSVILNKYADACKSLTERPGERLQQLLAR